MQRFGAPPVAGADVSAARHQVLGELNVVRERRGMQRRVAVIDLGLTLGDEAFVASRQPRSCQPRCSVERCPDDGAITRRNGHQQPGEVIDGGHTARYLGQAPRSADALSSVQIGSGQTVGRLKVPLSDQLHCE
jgi:hypothetical protein